MTITQTVEIPADYRIFLDLPRSVPIGAKAQVDINILPDKIVKKAADFDIEHVRLLLHKEMAEKETTAVIAENGDGWEAHLREKYAEP